MFSKPTKYEIRFTRYDTGYQQIKESGYSPAGSTIVEDPRQRRKNLYKSALSCKTKPISKKSNECKLFYNK
jgi:hypothetical protein